MEVKLAICKLLICFKCEFYVINCIHVFMLLLLTVFN